MCVHALRSPGLQPQSVTGRCSAGDELVEAAKRNDFCKVLVPGSSFFPLAAPLGTGEWGLWVSQQLTVRHYPSSSCPQHGLHGDCPILPRPCPCPAHSVLLHPWELPSSVSLSLRSERIKSQRNCRPQGLVVSASGESMGSWDERSQLSPLTLQKAPQWLLGSDVCETCGLCVSLGAFL